MAQFQKGNRFWELRSSHGRKPIFQTPEDLWNAACEYFEWNVNNPLYEEKAFAYQGVVTIEEVAKMRAMTIAGLLLFLDISDQAWLNYCGRADYVGVTNDIKKVIYKQKFEGASADLLNANIIARDLGLADKKDLSSSDGTMTPKQTVNVGKLTDEQLRAFDALISQASEAGAIETQSD